MQSVPITTNVVSSNSAHGGVYSIQNFVIKFCQWLAAGRWFSTDTPVSFTSKTDRHNVIVVSGAKYHNPNHKT